eukprot:scaffold3376_cov127-Isochrysis_galbana.AAC.3
MARPVLVHRGLPWHAGAVARGLKAADHPRGTLEDEQFDGALILLVKRPHAQRCRFARAGVPMMVIGRARVMTPPIVANTATTLPARVSGKMSPYPTEVSVWTHQYQPIRLETKDVGEESILYLGRKKGRKQGARQARGGKLGEDSKSYLTWAGVDVAHRKGEIGAGRRGGEEGRTRPALPAYA